MQVAPAFLHPFFCTSKLKRGVFWKSCLFEQSMGKTVALPKARPRTRIEEKAFDRFEKRLIISITTLLSRATGHEVDTSLAEPLPITEKVTIKVLEALGGDIDTCDPLLTVYQRLSPERVFWQF